jgi:hypothetical protein
MSTETYLVLVLVSYMNMILSVYDSGLVGSRWHSVPQVDPGLAHSLPSVYQSGSPGRGATVTASVPRQAAAGPEASMSGLFTVQARSPCQCQWL